MGLIIGLPGIGDQHLNTDVFNGLLLRLSAICADRNRYRSKYYGSRRSLSQRTACGSQPRPNRRRGVVLHFVSAHRVQIATAEVADLALHPVLCLSAPRADRNSGAGDGQKTGAALSQRTACRSQPQARQMGQGSMALSQRTACRSQRQMCTKHRVRICGMRCESVDSFSQHEDLLRADYFPELFCYQSSLRCH